MQSELFDKLIESKFDLFCATLGVISIVGAIYIYLNFYRPEPNPDIILKSIIFALIAFGYGFFL